MMRSARTQAGLTLLEMIIGLLLLTLLLTLLFAGMRLASRSWDRGDAYTTDVAQMQIVEDFLRREIEQVTPYRVPGAQPAIIYPGLHSSPYELNFAFPMPASGGSGGLYALRIGLLDTDHGKSAMLWRAPLGVPFDADDPVNQPVLLAENVADLSFSYFGRAPGAAPNAPAQWFDEWTDPVRPPLLVRMRLTLTDGRKWPDMIAAPHIDPQSAMGR